MNLNPVVIDSIVVALIVIFAIVQAKRGVYKMVMPIVILVLAVIIGSICAKVFTPVAAPWVWDKFSNVIESKIDEKVGEVLDKNLENIKEGLSENIEDIEAGINEFLESMDMDMDKLNDTLEKLGIDLNKLIDKDGSAAEDNGLSKSEDSKATKITKEYLEKLKNSGISAPELTTEIKSTIIAETRALVEKLVSIAIFIVAFVLAIILLNILKHACKGIANWFVIGWVNHGLGFILGLAEAVILLFIIVKIFGFAGSDFFDTISKDTVILRQFCNNSLKGVFDFITSPEVVNFIKK